MRFGGAGASPRGPEESSTLQSELDAAKEERDALLMLKREKEERQRAEAELALARTRSAEKKAQLAAAKARLANLDASLAGTPISSDNRSSRSVELSGSTTPLRSTGAPH